LIGDDENPQINDNGVVVWENQGDIYLYAGKDPERISDNPEFEGYVNTAPQICNPCNMVVWSGYTDSNWEIFKAVPGMELGIICTSLCPPVLGPVPEGNYPIVIAE
jgi:hypothetical protein